MISKKISYKKVILSIIIGIFLTFAYIGSVYADVGSFESYDSGGSSDWGSSSWSSSDWSSSSWDDDDDYSWSSSGSSGVFFGFGDVTFLIVIIIISVVITVLRNSNRRNRRYPQYQYTPQPTRPSSEEILRKIHAVDELFNQEEFLAWSKDLFVKLQNQWMARDWEEIRYFETNELFEQHKN